MNFEAERIPGSRLRANFSETIVNEGMVGLGRWSLCLAGLRDRDRGGDSICLWISNRARRPREVDRRIDSDPSIVLRR